MATLIIPDLEDTPWPTLGPQVCDWIEEHLVYGPGDLRGEPYRVEPEFRALIYRAYELVPQGSKGAGRRRFKRVAWNLRKGTAKTEKAAILAACELHPDAPVRCDGFDADGQPVGMGVNDPYVPLVAYTLDQTEELGYNVLRSILQESKIADDFDIGVERVLVKGPHGRAAGKAVALSSNPAARDGARTTFQHFDETHRMTSERLIRAHTTMMENTYKRVQADAWSLETTTMYDPAERSVAAETHNYAQMVATGKVKDSRLFYFYRHAPIEMPLETEEQVLEALTVSSGPAAAWSADLPALASRWFEPGTDKEYYRRVWLNQLVAGRGAAFDSVKWAEQSRPAYVVPAKAQISIGFDGSRTRDGTAIIACELASGYLWLAGYWQRPRQLLDEDEWEVPATEVDQVMEELFAKYKPVRAYCDPYLWVSEVDRWRGKWGDNRVISYATTQLRRMGLAISSFAESLRAGEITNDGSTTLAEHIANSVKVETTLRADDDTPLYKIEKERRGSPKKIDAAVAAVLAFQARNDAIAAGALKKTNRYASFA